MNRIKVNRTAQFQDPRDKQINLLLDRHEDMLKLLKAYIKDNGKLKGDVEKLTKENQEANNELLTHANSIETQCVNVRVLAVDGDILTLSSFVDTHYKDGRNTSVASRPKRIQEGVTYTVTTVGR